MKFKICYQGFIYIFLANFEINIVMTGAIFTFLDKCAIVFK